MADDTPAPAPASDGRDTSALVRRLARWLPFAMAGHLLVGVPALLISLVVAYGTYVQAGAAQRMQQAASWPFLAYRDYNYTGDGKRVVSLSLINNGLGPALIGPVEVRYRGRPMHSPIELLTSCCGYQAGQSMQLRTLPTRNVALRPGEETVFMALPDVPENAGMVDRLDAVRREIAVRACYCSIFEDCWTIDGAQAKPAPVQSCPADWTAFAER